jgi:glycosyltransferase involved in cell wall biosynthesis
VTLSPTHLVLIPAYNPGSLLRATVAAALAQWRPVWVVVDGSTDGSHEPIAELSRRETGLRLLIRETNGGKGEAVLTGAGQAAAEGFTHALVMDADGQHPADRIPDFMEASRGQPTAVICGRPVFGRDVPWIRLAGRQLSIGLVHWETAGRAAADPLFGFRVYPLAPLLAVMAGTSGARRYDFDPEVAVRLAWRGVPAVNRPAVCRYPARDEGGVSHFRYGRDNGRMALLHGRLLREKFLRR